VADAPQFEIPESVRELAQRNLDQARAAYNHFLDMARQAQDLVSKSSETMALSARELQQRALKYAEQNADTSFNFASDLARARDLKEYLDIQTRCAQRQMQTYAEQAQELGRLVAEATQRAAQPRRP
jgi:phasin